MEKSALLQIQGKFVANGQCVLGSTSVNESGFATNGKTGGWGYIFNFRYKTKTER
jgi:hypothetical protein